MKYSLYCLLSLCCLITSLEGAYTLRNGKLVNTSEVPKYSADRHYELGSAAMNSGHPREAFYHFNIIAQCFPAEPYYYDCQYYAGVCLYLDHEYDFANEALSTYLHSQSSPRFFEDAIGYKLQIANCFANGAKKRFFGTRMLPKWAPAKSLAFEIYDEVITSLPCHEYAAEALYAKACLYWQDHDFKGSVESFQLLIRRFPKHEMTPTAYLCINRVYLDQAACEFQNPDLLALAQINYKKFERDFPKEERLLEAAADVQAIKELYAKGLFDTGQFYERIEQPEASLIYYESAIAQFPDTSYAKCSKRRLEIVTSELDEGEACTPES